MTGLERIRERMPFAVFVLLVVLAALILGFACACYGGHSLQALERTLAAAAAIPAVVQMWVGLAVLAATLPALYVRRVSSTERASPALLQCFLR